MALCRLADRQGVLKGDLNSLQKVALEAVMMAEQRERLERDEARLKNDWIRTHPEKAKQIEAIFSKRNPDEELSADESEYNQVDEDTQRVLDNLMTQGFDVISG